MLQNACLLAKIGADTAENEQHFAEILLNRDVLLHRRGLLRPATSLAGTARATSPAKMANLANFAN